MNRPVRVRAVWVAATAVLTFAFQCFLAAAELPAIMVLTIKHEEDAGPGIAKMLTELVLQDIHDLKRFRVVGEKDINQMLNTEQRKQLAGCTDTSCLVEIAGAMGTQYTIDGTVGAVGSSSLLSLSLIDVSKANVVSRKTAVVKGEREQLLESVHKLMKELMEPVIGVQAAGDKAGSGQSAMGSGGATQPAPKAGVGAAEAKRNPPVPAAPQATATVAAPMDPYTLWGHVSFWSGFGIAGLGGVFSAMAAGAAGDYAEGGKDPAGSKDALSRNNALAVTCYVAGGLAMAAGVTLWILAPADGPRVGFVPRGGGGTVVVGGGW